MAAAAPGAVEAARRYNCLGYLFHDFLSGEPFTNKHAYGAEINKVIDQVLQVEGIGDYARFLGTLENIALTDDETFWCATRCLNLISEWCVYLKKNVHPVSVASCVQRLNRYVLFFMWLRHREWDFGYFPASQLEREEECRDLPIPEHVLEIETEYPENEHVLKIRQIVCPINTKSASKT